MLWAMVKLRLLSVGLCAVVAVSLPRASRGDDLTALSPRYLIEAIEVRGNHKTRAEVIARALKVRPNMVLAADDPRFELSRYRVLSLGHFSEVRLRLRRGSHRGRAVLVVQVTERGTITLTDVFLGVSEATDAWGGLGLAEGNLLGYGIGLEGAFVIGADPDVERGTLQQSYWLRATSPRLGDRRVHLSGAFLFLDGSEFFRRTGPESSSSPSDFLSVRYRRVGGAWSGGVDLTRYTRLSAGYRAEAVKSDVPAAAVRRVSNGGVEPIVFGIRPGDSVLSNLSLVLERDTRSDPVVPEAGGRFQLSAEVSARALGSSYNYLRLAVSYQHYFALRWGHIISPQIFGGVIFGEAPFFEKFFIGDLNDLVPSRALGLNFSTLPSRDIFGTSIDSKRYEELAIRAAVEYIVPWFRGSGSIYSGDFFLNVGLILLTSKEEIALRDRPLAESLPVDLTIDVGLRLDTRIGVFRLSLGNALGRIPF